MADQTYAVIQTQGKQYLVKPGDSLVVDHLPAEEGKKYVFDQVLLRVDKGKTQVGTPFVKGAKVEATVETHQLGKKVRVAKFKAKSRYRRVQGFRPHQTKLVINKI